VPYRSCSVTIPPGPHGVAPPTKCPQWVESRRSMLPHKLGRPEATEYYLEEGTMALVGSKRR
jgi:hypothetical protein